MIQSFTIINHLGESIFIDIRRPEATGFLISSVTGLEPVKAVISQSETGLYDGSIISGSRLEARNIVFNILFFMDNNEKLSIEQIRRRSYVYFPVKKEIEIIVQNDSGKYRIKGIVETNEVPIFAKEEATQISVICSDPYFERAEDAGSSVYVSRVVPNFSFPVSFEAVIADMPPEEYQEDEGLEKIIDERGNVYWRYHGPFSTVSDAYNAKVLNLAGMFSNDDITVNKIPYVEEENASGGVTVKIGGNPNGNS